MCDNPVRDCMAMAGSNKISCPHYKECMVWYVTNDGEMTRLLKQGEYRKGGKYGDYFHGKQKGEEMEVRILKGIKDDKGQEIIGVEQKEFKGVKEARVAFSIFKNALFIVIDKKEYLSMGTISFEEE